MKKKGIAGVRTFTTTASSLFDYFLLISEIFFYPVGIYVRQRPAAAATTTTLFVWFLNVLVNN